VLHFRWLSWAHARLALLLLLAQQSLLGLRLLLLLLGLALVVRCSGYHPVEHEGHSISQERTSACWML
jgi:hypothetical protein